jgi:two-component SAPR family response regulator
MTPRLATKRILVVEDDGIISDNLAFEIAAEGGEVIGPAETVDAALDAIANTRLDGATLNVKLMGKMAFRVADALVERQIPFIFFTGYTPRDVIPAHYAKVCCLEKPATPQQVCRALEAMLAAR